MITGVIAAVIVGLLAGCAASSPVEEGDCHFRLEEFALAAQSYEEAGAADSPDPELQHKLAEARYRVYTDAAQDLLHLERPADALKMLDVADSLQPGHPVGQALRQRAYFQLAADYTEEGDQHTIDGDPKQAAEAYASALSWNPDYEPAQEGLARSQDQLNRLHHVGEQYYFRGLEDLRAGNELRAHTALTHAVTYWGNDSRAGEHLHEISVRLAAQSVERARIYLDSRLLGPAWLELRNAQRLDPELQEVGPLLAQAESDLAAERSLGQADMAVRAGDPDRADAKLAEASALSGERYSEPIEEIQRRNEAERLHEKYLVAYAAELDGQTVTARDLYFQVLEAGGGEDVADRYENMKHMVELAEQLYQEALAAESGGDSAAYEAKLAQCLRLSRDYADALERYSALQRAKREGKPAPAPEPAPQGS